MTAWDILTSNSTSPSESNAWVHLLNQKVGEPFPIENISVDFISEELKGEYTVDILEGEIKDSFTIDIINTPLNGEIIDNTIDSTIC